MTNLELVKKFICEEIVQDNIDLDENDSLIETGIIDSLGIIRLISLLEKQFHLEIAPNDITPENFDKIESISEFMAKYNFLNTPD